MDLLTETEVELPPLDDEQPICIGGETAEEAALTTNIYGEIRRRLAERGIPAEQVAFIHDAKTPADRAALFKAVNEGKIRVLIGSTEKMGTGMNAQERLVAIHQITPPWRPGDLEQQAGRMIRQGNRYPEVFQFVHVTGGSFDGYVWQLLENKAGFIGQIAGGEVTAREVDDVSENVLTFSEIKALASGNPKIMEKVIVDTELARLDAVRQGWLNTQRANRIMAYNLTARRGQREQDIVTFSEAIATRNAHTSEKFSILLLREMGSPDLQAMSERELAGKRIRALSAGTAFVISPGSGEALEIGRYRGFSLMATILRTPTGPAPQVYVQVGPYQLAVNIGESDAGVTMSLDAKLRSFETELQKAQEEFTVFGQKLASIETEANRPWDHEERYQVLLAKAAELDKALNLGNAQPSGENAEEAAPAESTPATPVHTRRAEVVDTSADVLAALESIRALHANLELLSRFGSAPAPTSAAPEATAVTPAAVEAMERQVEQAQAQLEFAQAVLAAIPSGEAVQLSLFGDFAAAPAKKRRR